MLTSSIELNFIVKKPSEYDLSETLILNFENRLLIEPENLFLILIS